MMSAAAASEELMTYVLTPGEDGATLCEIRFPGSNLKRSKPLYDKKGLQRLGKKEFVTAQDRRILMRLYMAASKEQQQIQFTGKVGFQILEDIVRTGRCVWEEGTTALHWSERKVRAKLGWKLLDPKGKDAVLPTQRPCLETTSNLEIVATAPLAGVDLMTGEVMEVECGFPSTLACAWLNTGEMEAEMASHFFAEMAKKFPECKVPEPGAFKKRTVTNVIPRPVFDIRQREFYPRALGCPLKLFVGKLTFDYDGHLLRYQSKRAAATTVQENELIEIQRNRNLETKEAEWLLKLGLKPLAEVGAGYELEDAANDFVVPPEETTDPSAPAVGQSRWHHFLAHAQGELEKRGWTFRFEGQRRLAVAPTENVVTIGPSEKQGWFEFELGILVDGKRVNLLPLVHDLLKRYAKVSPDQFRDEIAGQVFFVPTIGGMTHVFTGERFAAMVERIFELYDRDPFHAGEKMEVGSLRAAELAELFEVDGEIPGIPESVRQIARILRDGITIAPVADPEKLQAELRDYQKIGVGWLRFLAENQLNGVLADDMGLGKTLQTIAHLVSEKDAGRLDRPALLVAPTSLMKNWRDELEKFAPHLVAITLHGNDRLQQFRAVSNADIVITTYGLMRRDAFRHAEINYSWIILDEAQFIKNPNSKVTEVLSKLKSDRRLCLTGTPIENHLGELWSLFHFLMPGFLGEEESFKRQFRIPIEQEQNEAMLGVLTRRVKPFLLRRKKIEVVSELPPKTEIDHPVEMTRKQADVYESVRVAMHKKVKSEIAERGLARSQIVILDALMKLRQICCDPRLAKLGEEGLTWQHSAKLAELMELLPDMLGDGHRILVFSQFTSMLKLIEEQLHAAKIDHVKLTGSTQNRGRAVDAFQSGKVPLFLISLRAGGTGLNLTEANTVIHYDPWWNPQVENQATDRAYRIGQQRPVFVYKMIAEGTVEEKIVAMQKRKAALAEGILSGGESAKLKFEEDDVAALFE
tara:strand:- start:14385 stop:17321 length:2937 start_codon:yes stop_codon:yes gene_type:complete